MGTRKVEILYIHPGRHLNDLTVPAGALSCMNALGGPRLGRYAFEVDEQEVREARVVAIDLHWAVGLPGFVPLVHRVRRTNPEAAIVVGGITAGHYAADLVERLPVDYVVRGDSEESFGRLVEDLLGGGPVGPIPNVVSREWQGPRVRMTSEAFDRTDCLSAQWFPTLERVGNWDAQAFGQGRTIPVARGCVMRCRACYGSFASLFGDGVLFRTPLGVAREVGRAKAMGCRNLRLILGRIPPQRLSPILQALARSGPFSFDSAVGLYLCTPPSDEDLACLEEAFPGRVALSLIPPDEYEPVLFPDRLDREWDTWRRVAARVSRSPTLSLDVWATRSVDRDRLERLFLERRSPSVRVNLGPVWNLTRPTDASLPDLDEVREAMEPAWTFYAARLLSPSLAEALLPFRLLDEMDQDPALLEPPEGPAGLWWPRVMEWWERHRLPALPGIRWWVGPVRLLERPVAARSGARCAGVAGFARAEGIEDLPWTPLGVRGDEAGVRMEGVVSSGTAGDALALVPSRPDGSADASWAATLLDHGALVLRGNRSDPIRVRVVIRVQDASIHLEYSGGTDRGRVDLGYFRVPGRSGG